MDELEPQDAAGKSEKKIKEFKQRISPQETLDVVLRWKPKSFASEL